VLTFDYLGALAVSILFPVLLVPHLGPDAQRPVVRPAQRRWSRCGRAGCSASSCTDAGWLRVQGGVSLLALLAALPRPAN
jgi:hypothetical protein